MIEAAIAERALLEFAIPFALSTLGFGGGRDGTERKIDRLLESHLSAGLSSLEQAIHSQSERDYLYREARQHLNQAAFLTEGLNKCKALSGLVICHNHFGDYDNVRQALRGILAIEPQITNPEIAIASVNATKDAAARAVTQVSLEGVARFVVQVPMGAITALPSLVSAPAEFYRFFKSQLSVDEWSNSYRALFLFAVSEKPDTRELTSLQLKIATHLREDIPWRRRLGC